MGYDLDFIIKELSRRPHFALVIKDPQTRLYRVDWKDGKKHHVRTFSDLSHAISSAKNLQLHGTVIGFRVVAPARPQHSWVPSSALQGHFG